jgi:hypothetical protein
MLFSTGPKFWQRYKSRPKLSGDNPQIVLLGKSKIYMVKSLTKKYICKCRKISVFWLASPVRGFSIRILLCSYMEIDHPQNMFQIYKNIVLAELKIDDM